MGETRMSLLPGVQRSALGGAGAGALGSRLLLLLFSLALFLLALLGGGALRSRFSSSAYPTAAAQRSRFATGLMGILSPPNCGGIVDKPGHETNPDAIELARFAVAVHNNKTSAALEFVRLVKVRHQLVAGDMYYFTIEVREVDGGGANKLYEAKVWLRPWEDLKGLRAFEPVANAEIKEKRRSAPDLTSFI